MKLDCPSASVAPLKNTIRLITRLVCYKHNIPYACIVVYAVSGPSSVVDVIM